MTAMAVRRGKGLEATPDRWGVVHARIAVSDAYVGGRWSLLCDMNALPARRAVEYSAWSFPVTCLWCFVRLVRA